MFKLGLVSVTFRDLSVEEVLEISQKAGISGIEWGGDVHVPPNSVRAEEIGRLTEASGMETVTYGSYYCLGETNDYAFTDILGTAQQLRASGIRVWAGKLGSQEANAIYRNLVVEDAKRIADLAKHKGLVIHLEYHGNTLTDTAESTATLMEAIDRENVYSYWQPAVGLSVEKRLENIATIQDWISHVHAFHWHGTDRQPFEDGVKDWEKYLQALDPDSDKHRYLMMEFVKDNDVEQFYADVEVLGKIVTHSSF